MATKKPTAAEIIKQAKAKGLDIKKSPSKVNGLTVYTVKGKPGMFSLGYIENEFLGIPL